jgi:ubiquinone/menaquinone biosynthesis C-methylase UbiE
MVLIPAQIADEWNVAAEGYNHLISPLTSTMAGPVLEALALNHGEILLDVAAGTGTTAIPAAKTGAKVTAVDFSKTMVQHLNKNAKAEGVEVTTHVMDGQNLEFEDGSFDAACSVYGIMFFPELAKGFSELYRVLKDDGRVVIATDPLPKDDPFTQVVGQALVSAIPSIADGPEEIPPNLRLAQPGAFKKHFTDAGFRDIDIKVVQQDIKIDDPAKFWMSLGPSLPPVKPLFKAFGTEVMEKVANFSDIMAEKKVNGIPTVGLGALIGVAKKS